MKFQQIIDFVFILVNLRQALSFQNGSWNEKSRENNPEYLFNIRSTKDASSYSHEFRYFGGGVGNIMKYEKPDSSVGFFSTFRNQVHILVEDAVYDFVQDDRGNIVDVFRHVLPSMDPFVFVESVKYADKVLVLVGYKTKYAHLFIATSSTNTSTSTSEKSADPDNNGRQSSSYFVWESLKLVQTISTRENLRPVSAKFIQHKHQLFLTIIYGNNQQAKADSIIYQWTGKHMDELYTMETRSASDLVVIHRPSYYLLVVAQQSQYHVEESAAFKFDPDTGVSRLRSIKASGFKVLYYKTPDQEDYVLFMNDKNESKAFKIDEIDNFHETKRKYNFQDILSAGVFQSDDFSLIVLCAEDSISFYTPQGGDLHRSYGFSSEFGQIIDFKLIENSSRGEVYTLLLMSRTYKSLSYFVLPFEWIKNLIVTSESKDDLKKRLEELEEMLDERQAMIDELEKTVRLIKIEHIVPKFGAEVNILEANEVTLSNSVLDFIDICPEETLVADTNDLLEAVQVTQETAQLLEEAASHVYVKGEPFAISSHIHVRGDLIIKNASGEYLNVNKINERPFSESSYIFRKDDDSSQVLLPEIFTGKKLTIENLLSPVFYQHIANASTIKSLEASNIMVADGRSINGIIPERIVVKEYSRPISGTKTFQDLNVNYLETVRYGKELLTPWIQKAVQGQLPMKNLHVENDVFASHLQVNTINGIDITNLMDSSFIRGSSKKIEGDIKFVSDLSINRLQTNSINNINVSDFLTKTTHQEIRGFVDIRNMLVKNLNTETVNGIDLKKDAALIGPHNTINSPTTIMNLEVLNNLFLNCGPDNQSFCNIMETKKEDLLQIYNGPVTIRGDLLVSDLKFAKDAKMIVDGEDFHTEIESLYWLKEKSQTIPNDVTFLRGISAPQITSQMINGIPVDSFYSIFNDNRNVSLIFREAEVKKDFTSLQFTQCSIIRELDQQTVKTSGQYYITGKKTFVEKLQINNLKTDVINDFNMEDMILKSDADVKFYGETRLKAVMVEGDLTTLSDPEVYIVNEKNLQDFVSNALKTNVPFSLKNVLFTNAIQGDTLFVNDCDLSDIHDVISKAHENIIVEVDSDAHIQEFSGLETLNGVNFDDYIGRVVKKSEPEKFITGVKTFKGKVLVTEDVGFPYFNEFPLNKLMNSALTKSGYQIITGYQNFENIFVDDIYTDKVNGKFPSELIDFTSKEPIFLQSDVYFENLEVFGDLYGLNTSCNLNQISENLNNMGKKRYSEVIVEGDVYWLEDEFIDMLEHGVRSDKENVIFADVVFEKPVTVDTVNSKFPINNIDIGLIWSDSVKKYTDVPQVITGKKVFKADVNVHNVYSENIYGKMLNGMDVLYFNSSMVRLDEDEEILDDVIFEEDVYIHRLQTSSLINGIAPQDIAFVGDGKVIKEIHLEAPLIAEDVNLEYINNINVPFALENGIKLKGSEQHIYSDVIFEELHLENCQINKIDGVPVNEMVFDEKGKTFVTHEDVIFNEDVLFNGPVEINEINGENIEELFKNTVFVDADTEFSGDVEVESSGVLYSYGDIFAENTINGVNMAEHLHNNLTNTEDTINNIINYISHSLYTLQHHAKNIPIEFLYAEPLLYLEDKFYDVRVADIRNYNNFIEINLHEYAEGGVCGMKSQCLCPVHKTVTISDTGKLKISKVVANTRFYNILSPPGYSVVLSTTENIQNKFCSNSNEVGKNTIIWHQDGERPDSFTDIGSISSGFISDLKSFYKDGQYYIILNQYYDKIIDSYSLDTLLLRIDFDQRQLILIQKMSGSGSWTSELIHHKDDSLDLVIANTNVNEYFSNYVKNSFIQSPILRFNPTTTKFELIQYLSTEGCRSLNSISIDPLNVFLMVGHRQALSIFRYLPETTSYGSFQNIPYLNEIKAISSLTIGHENGQKRKHLLFVAVSEELYIYQLTNNEGWQFHSSGIVSGLQNIVPYKLGKNNYLFTPSYNSSIIMSLVSQGI